MEKNALYNIDLWKEEISKLIKHSRSELRIAIKNEIADSPNEKLTSEEIVQFVQTKHNKAWAGWIDGNPKKLTGWLKQQDSVEFLDKEDPQVFVVDESYIEKDKEEKETDENIIQKEDSRKGKFTINRQDDGNINLIIDYKKNRFAWLIDIGDTDDIYNLFGKSVKYPAIVAEKINGGKVIDKGNVILGVQKDGYHEYKLEGDKFDTRIHVRVVPLNEKKTWIVWTGKKQDMLKDEDDVDVWNIQEDKYSNLEFPPKIND